MHWIWSSEHMDAVSRLQLWQWNVCWRHHSALLSWLHSTCRLGEGNLHAQQHIDLRCVLDSLSSCRKYLASLTVVFHEFLFLIVKELWHGGSIHRALDGPQVQYLAICSHCHAATLRQVYRAHMRFCSLSSKIFWPTAVMVSSWEGSLWLTRK